MHDYKARLHELSDAAFTPIIDEELVKAVWGPECVQADVTN